MKITIEIPDDEVQLIERFLASTNDKERESSHGRLDLRVMIDMLLEDVALMVDKPQSFPAVNMRQVMDAHGYETLPAAAERP